MTRPEKELEITYWLLDTRTLWPGDKIATAVRSALFHTTEHLHLHFLTLSSNRPLANMLLYYRPPTSSNSSAP